MGLPLASSATGRKVSWLVPSAPMAVVLAWSSIWSVAPAVTARVAPSTSGARPEAWAVMVRLPALLGVTEKVATP